MAGFVRIRAIELLIGLAGAALFIVGMIYTGRSVLFDELPLVPLAIAVVGMVLVAFATETRAKRLRRFQRDLIDDKDDLRFGGSKARRTDPLA